MKKLGLSLAFALVALLFTVSQSLAVNVNIKGDWNIAFEYGQGGDLVKGYGDSNIPGYTSRGNGGYDDFVASQRVRLWIFFRQSETLAGMLMFKIPTGGLNQYWGSANYGAAIGADGLQVSFKAAALMITPPQTGFRMTLGIQGFAFPSFTETNQHLENTVAGITASKRFSDTFSLTAAWFRTFNDNYTDANGYLDNTDLFGVFLPITTEAVKVTPWAMFGMMGKNGNRVVNPHNTVRFNSFWWNRGRDLDADIRKMRPYGEIYMLGLTSSIELFDPFRLAFDVQYTGRSTGNSRYDQQGYLATLLAEYKLDSMIPGIYGWYGSGEDGNRKNGSERMYRLTYGLHGSNSFSSMAFYGAQCQIVRQGLLNFGMDGTMGVGVRLKNIALSDDFKTTVRAVYINGTNDKGGISPNGRYNAPLAPFDPYLLATDEYALEVSASCEYKIYENLRLLGEAGYLNLNRKSSRRPIEKKRDDAWNLSLTFAYEF